MDNFEWDINKRKGNLEKHGVDFYDAIQVFSDPDRVEVVVVKNNEKRYKTLGLIHGLVMCVVYTKRNKKRRIILVRRANKSERKTYEAIKSNKLA